MYLDCWMITCIDERERDPALKVRFLVCSVYYVLPGQVEKEYDDPSFFLSF